MTINNRWLVIAIEGGEVRSVEPFNALKPAKSRADKIGSEMNVEDDVMVWDLALNRVGYNPLKGIDIY